MYYSVAKATELMYFVANFQDVPLMWNSVILKSYCLCLCGTALWLRYKTDTVNNLKSAYNRYLKIFFGYRWHFSVIQLLLELYLPSWDTLIIRIRCLFTGSIARSASHRYLIYSRGRFWGVSPRRGDMLHWWGWNLVRRRGPNAKFHPHRCNG